MSNQNTNNSKCNICQNKAFPIYFNDDDGFNKIHDADYCFLHGILRGGNPIKFEDEQDG